MRIAIQDANIIIDLIECGIFEAFFELGIETHTTTLVLEEIERDHQRRKCVSGIKAKRLHLHEISTDHYLSLLSEQRGGLSVTDLSVLELAAIHKATLLTGDGAIRKTARSKHITVRGILWVFDQLVHEALISQTDAVNKLEKLKAINTRLPIEEIDKRIEAWSE